MSTQPQPVLRPVAPSNAVKDPDSEKSRVSRRGKLAAGRAPTGEKPRGKRAAKPSTSRRIRCRRSSVWREQVRSRLAELRVELDSVPNSQGRDARYGDARQRLEEAAAIIDRKPSLLDVWTGVDVEATWMRIHAIEVALVRVSAPKVIQAKLPGIIDDGSHLLGEGHLHVKMLRTYQKRVHWDDDERECLAQSIRAVYEASDKENVRLRSFRNILLGATCVLAVLAIGFAVFGAISPSAIDQLADSSSSRSPWESAIAAPSRAQILIVEMLGLISAALVGAVAIRRIQGTSTVYGVPMASLLLKLPTGALTALAGILMIRAGMVPLLTTGGDSHLGAYALLFGASQQGFTGLVDRQTHNILSNVASKDNA